MGKDRTTVLCIHCKLFRELKDDKQEFIAARPNLSKTAFDSGAKAQNFFDEENWKEYNGYLFYNILTVAAELFFKGTCGRKINFE